MISPANPYPAWVAEARWRLDGRDAPHPGDPEERVAALLAPGRDLRGRIPAYLDRRERGGRELAAQAQRLLRALYQALIEAENTGVFVDVGDATSTAAAGQVLVVEWMEPAPARLVHFSDVELRALVLGGAAPRSGLPALYERLVNDSDIYRPRRAG